MTSMLNRSVIDEVRVDRAVHTANTDNEQNLLKIRYASGQKTTLTDPATADNDKYVRFYIDANGSTASKFQAVLNIGRSSADYDQYQFSYDGAEETDNDGVAGVVAGTDIYPHTCLTMQDLIDELNDIPGVDAQILHCLSTLTLDSDDFIDVASFAPKHMIYTACGLRDFSEIFTTAIRIGIPEPVDSGRMRLLAVEAAQTGATAGTVKVYRDDPSAQSPVELLGWTAVATTRTKYLDNDMLNAATFRGPLVVQVTGSDLTAIDLVVRTVQAEY